MINPNVRVCERLFRCADTFEHITFAPSFNRIESIRMESSFVCDTKYVRSIHVYVYDEGNE